MRMNNLNCSRIDSVSEVERKMIGVHSYGFCALKIPILNDRSKRFLLTGVWEILGEPATMRITAKILSVYNF